MHFISFLYYYYMGKFGKGILILLLFYVVASAPILKPQQLQNSMFVTQISGDLKPLLPTKLGISPLWPYPIDVYQISAMRARHQFLPDGFPSTQIFAYGGKVNGKFQPSFPGPAIMAFKNMPIYVIYSNEIEGKHILPIDTSVPLGMSAKFLNEVPTVPHAHGLETQMGSDGQPNGYWMKSGKKGPDYFSLRSKFKKQNQAIYRYHNTKQGLFWFHDHTMGITRLNVYAGLVGFYEIIDPLLSIQQNNILRFYGDIERKYFAIVDKSFQQDGSLYYPNTTKSQGFTSWVPQFFGNTITVNGKVWPKIILQPKKYRFVFLNGCQSRFINFYFQHKNKAINFQLFRRDSDFLRAPVTMSEHLLLVGGRIQIFIDLTGKQGEVLMRNNASTPFPMGEPVDQFTSQIMKIIVKKPQSKPKTVINENKTSNSTFVSTIADRLQYYAKNQPVFQTSLDSLDFLDQPQAININQNQDQLRTISSSSDRVIKIQNFLNSNDPKSGNDIQFINSQSELMQNSQNKADTGAIMNKINTQAQALQTLLRKRQNPAYNSGYFSKGKLKQMNISITNVPYPKFSAGKPHFTILNQVRGTNGEPVSVKIDNIGLDMLCEGSNFKQGQTYDFYIINLTMDDHPIHIHLINFQIIGRFKFDVQRYIKDWKNLNGQFKVHGVKKAPEQLDVRPYKTSDISAPMEEQKLFTDVIHVPTEQVTIARIKFYNHNGKSFPFTIKGGRYVWHCHILEHEDNQMMRYFCVQ